MDPDPADRDRGERGEGEEYPESFRFAGREIPLGEVLDVDVALTESFSGFPVTLPVRVVRGRQPGPAVFVTGALHGDELNGTGVIRELILRPPFRLERGTLVLVPVVNVLGFERHSRYLPDRRDLNRSFPGSATGSLASRLANRIFEEIVRPCQYGIDLHTAAVRRTNFPNIRADLERPEVRRIAEAFGCELVVPTRGPKGAFRRAACAAGCATITLEAGEVWKIEPSVLEIGVRGVHNVLVELGMVEGRRRRPLYQVRIESTRWVRAEVGGILHFHVAPGDVVEEGQALATNSSLLGVENRVLRSPVDGVVLGMITLPAVVPGGPVCHLAIPERGIGTIRRAQDRASEESLHERLRDDLATSLAVSEPPAEG